MLLLLLSNESFDEQLSDLGDRDECLVMTRLLLSLQERQDDRDVSFEFFGEVVLKLMPSSCD